MYRVFVTFTYSIDTYMSKTVAGTLYMIPLPIAEEALHTLPAQVATVTAGLRHYFAENVRTARRFLRTLHPALVLEEIQFSEIDKHAGADMGLLRRWLAEGQSIGVMSEAGCPGIADPGSVLAAAAHAAGARVVPVAGPSALLLAMMASGLNGQSFAFGGYLPVKEPARGKAIKEAEARSGTLGQTQLFIETPYRNNQMLQDLVKHCQPGTRICIAMDVTGPAEYIKTNTAAYWKTNPPQLPKAPAIFLILAMAGSK